jgi:hypothetical protein
MASIDELKSLTSKRNGFARPNQFLVELPAIGGVSPSEMNILCTRASLPDKQILTADRRISMEFEKIAYGYAVNDVAFAFYALNDYGPRKYLDAWRNRVIDEETLEVGYKVDYEFPIKIHQLKKPVAGFSRNIGPLNISLDIGGGSVYSVELINAFPTTIQSIDFSNELDGLVEISTQVSFTNWRVIEPSQNFINANIAIGL